MMMTMRKRKTRREKYIKFWIDSVSGKKKKEKFFSSTFFLRFFSHFSFTNPIFCQHDDIISILLKKYNSWYHVFIVELINCCSKYIISFYCFQLAVYWLRKLIDTRKWNNKLTKVKRERERNLHGEEKEIWKKEWENLSYMETMIETEFSLKTLHVIIITPWLSLQFINFLLLFISISYN